LAPLIQAGAVHQPHRRRHLVIPGASGAALDAVACGKGLMFRHARGRTQRALPATKGTTKIRRAAANLVKFQLIAAQRHVEFEWTGTRGRCVTRSSSACRCNATKDRRRGPEAVLAPCLMPGVGSFPMKTGYVRSCFPGACAERHGGRTPRAFSSRSHRRHRIPNSPACLVMCFRDPVLQYSANWQSGRLGNVVCGRHRPVRSPSRCAADAERPACWCMIRARRRPSSSGREGHGHNRCRDEMMFNDLSCSDCGPRKKLIRLACRRTL